MKNTKTGISGFTIVRNAGLLKYPFLESVRSVLPICDEFIINCGDSSDDTLELCQKLEEESDGKLKIVQSVWDIHDQQGGFQLKHQTDTTMAYCGGKWCLYIQADEVIHEEDHPRILKAIEHANQSEEVDGILFDYRHFYGSYEYIIEGRNWYRREVRAFKNHRGIASFRDAQGFRREEKRLKVLPSGARVFHYGYVRNPDSMKVKSMEMSRWWGSKPVTDENNLTPVRHVGLRRFVGSHPDVMNTLVEHDGMKFDPRLWPRRWNKDEIKNAVTLVWEKFFPFRIGEFRNYEIVKSS